MPGFELPVHRGVAQLLRRMSSAPLRLSKAGWQNQFALWIRVYFRLANASRDCARRGGESAIPLRQQQVSDFSMLR
jgi:hypothetical protein